MRILFFVVLTIFSIFVFGQDLGRGQISFKGDVVHVEFSGQKKWDYKIDRQDQGSQSVVELYIQGIDPVSLKSFEKFKSNFVKSITKEDKSIDNKTKISFILSDSDIEFFDYQTEGPSRLIIDFYQKEDSKEKKSSNKQVNSPVLENKTTNVQQSQKSKKTNRKPATADFIAIDPKGNLARNEATSTTVKAGIFDGADPDYSRFQVKDYEIKEDAIIKAQTNIYMPYPMLENESPYWSQIKNTPPIYQIKSDDSDENKQARLLLTLFEKERYLVFQKTLGWFRQKYPDSKYNDMLTFMEADVEMSLFKQTHEPKRFAQAIELYKQAIRKYPESPLAEKVSLMLPLFAFDRGDQVLALRLFQDHIDNTTIKFQSPFSKELAELGQVQTFENLKRFDEAVKRATEIEKKSSNKEIKAEAAYRIGDALYKAKKYPESIQAYKEATQKYPESLAQFPGAIYNSAESLFINSKYKESLNTFLDFIKKFPKNDHSALAMTRIGEIMEILGVDPSKAMGAYLEAYFRFGENPKAIVARIRLTGARMKSMKPKEVESATQEILALAKKLDWPQVESFATLTVVDGFADRGEYNKAIDLLVKYYQDHPTANDLNLYQNRLVNNINLQIQKELNDGNFIQALKTHQKYSDNWLKSSHRLDTEYNLGFAFEMGGAYKEAEKFYKETLNRFYAIQGTPEEKKLLVLENLPSDQVMNLRLAAVKAQQGQWSESYDYMKNIKKPETMPEKNQIERVILASEILEKKGDLLSASRFINELLRTWKGEPELVAEPYLRLSEVEIKQGKKTEAIQSLEKIKQLSEDSKNVPDAILAKMYPALIDLYEKEKNESQLVKNLNEYLSMYEEKKPLASQRYRLGLIYFQKGEIKKANEIWGQFKGAQNDFWKKLAEEKLKDSQWQSGYKKYIERIPAMAKSSNEMKQGESR